MIGTKLLLAVLDSQNNTGGIPSQIFSVDGMCFPERPENLKDRLIPWKALPEVQLHAFKLPTPQISSYPPTSPISSRPANHGG